jgi:hypothetical protein
MTADPPNSPIEPSPPSADTSPSTLAPNSAPAAPQLVRTVAPDPWAHRRGEPRTFAAIWLLFLFAATILSVGAVGIFGLASTDVYRPAARVMLEVVTVGIVVLWPMVRLSQEAPKRPIRALILDALVILVPAQAVLWPQALSWMAGWPIEVVGAAAGLLSGWGLLISGLLALYFAAESPASPRREVLPRWAMMALIILLIGIGPVAFALRSRGPAAGPGADWLMSSPLTGIYEITRDRLWTGHSAAIDQRHRIAIWLTWCSAAAVWAFAWLAAGRSKGMASTGRPA